MIENLENFSEVWKLIWQLESNTTTKVDNLIVIDENNVKVIIPQEDLQFLRKIFLCVGVVLFLINLPVIISSGLILKRGQQPKSTYLLLGNISMADMITGLILIIIDAHPYKYRTPSFCYILICLGIGSAVSSVYSVAYIAIDRYLFIIHGLKYKQWVRPIRIRILIIITWIIGMLISFSLMMGLNRDKNKGKICLAFLVASKEYIILFTILLQLPLFVSGIFHFIILHRAIKKVLEMRRNNIENMKGTTQSSLKMRVFKGCESFNHHNGTNKENRKKISANAPSTYKAIKVVFFTTGTFTVTMMPFLWASFLYTLCDPITSKEYCERLKYLCAVPFHLLYILNGIMNPIIYAWWHKGFRKTLKNIYLKKFGNQNLDELDIKQNGIRNRSHSIATISNSSDVTFNKSQSTQSISSISSKLTNISY